MLRYLLAALALAACTPTMATPHGSTAGPLDGLWAIETTALPDSGCTFSGEVVMERPGESVLYHAALSGRYACPDGREHRTRQFCEAYDLAVLQMNCTVDPAMATPDYPGDQFNMQRPLMQAPVEEMTGSIRLPESEYDRLSDADYIKPHLVRWRRVSRDVPAP